MYGCLAEYASKSASAVFIFRQARGFADAAILLAFTMRRYRYALFSGGEKIFEGGKPSPSREPHVVGFTLPLLFSDSIKLGAYHPSVFQAKCTQFFLSTLEKIYSG